MDSESAEPNLQLMFAKGEKQPLRGPASLVLRISRIRVISRKTSRIITNLCNNTEYPIVFLPCIPPVLALISPCAATEKPQPTAGTAKKAPNRRLPTDGKPCGAMHSISGKLQGLLLLVCLWLAMASGQGEALRRGPALRAEVQVEPPVATAIDSSSQTSPQDARILGSPDGAGSYKSTYWCAAVGGGSVPRSVGCGYAALGGQQSNSRTRATSNTRIAQNKAKAICAGRRGGAGHVMVMAPAEDARGFESRPRNSDCRAAKPRRRTKPRQSVRVARAPPCA